MPKRPEDGPLVLSSNLTQDRVRGAVRKAKEHIAAGDIYQVVLSQRFDRPSSRRPVHGLSRAPPRESVALHVLRAQGPRSIVGSSPEMLVRVEGRTAVTHPIAGTRPRGRTEDEDQRLADELKRNEKERAEHVMLVDLGRNDIGRVSAYGTVRVPRYMSLEKYSHVMHLVSVVEGQLAEGNDRLDALAACFPAGTVSGAPKVRAMQIINELEPGPRGVSTPARSATSILPATSTSASPFAPSCSNTAGPTCRPAPGSSRIRTRRPSTTRPRIKPAPWCGRSNSRARDSRPWCWSSTTTTRSPSTWCSTWANSAPISRCGATTTITVDEVEHLQPARIVISPGPGHPAEAGISVELIRRLADHVPILGVCLGHQAIGHAFGGRIGRAPTPKHGKTSLISHDGRGVFQGLAGPLEVGRYHSLLVADEGWPEALEVAARADDDGVVMALRHTTYPLHGVQFHPESVLTGEGRLLLRNFLEHRLMFAGLLSTLLRRDDLTVDQAAQAMAAVMSGEAHPAQVAALLIGLAMKGERPAELVGFARTMRARGVTIDAGPSAVDTCGTGGDRAGTFNISTAAALVVAGAGVPVVKHGNRSVSSHCGSADVLEALGVTITAPPAVVQRAVTEAGIGFCFAPTFHPAMRHAVEARKALGVPTAFNLLGPLTNPARVRFQVVGVARPELTELMARALQQLGAERAWVVHGADGLDELSTTGYTKVSECHGAVVRTFYVHPADVGVAKAAPAICGAGTPPTTRA